MRPPLQGNPIRVTQPIPHRAVRRLHCALAAGAAAVIWGCGGSPAEPKAGSTDGPSDFSGALAWAELEEIAKEPRPLGSDGAEAARSVITAQLGAANLAVETITTTIEAKSFGPIALTHLVARLPGASPDRIVLLAPYDSGKYDDFTFVGANDGASGAAVLLELARVLSARALPYTVELIWLDGEGRIGLGVGDERELRWLGSRTLADRWAQTGNLSNIRLLISFNRVCDPDLRIARDSSSNRELRETFWRAARQLGFGAAFPNDRGYESVTSSHTAFRDRGVRPVVAIEDTAFGGDDAPGPNAGKEDVLDQCAPDSLQVVGRVAASAVESIATRLAKIDRFSRTPSADVAPKRAKSTEEAQPAPPPAPAPPTAESATDATAPQGAPPEASDAAGKQ
jgi:glutaminyl-peptide cyclotransferase